MAVENVNGIASAIAPELQANIVGLPLEAMVEGVTELEDGSAIIGDMEMEAETPTAIPFDSNLAEHIDEDILQEISSQLVGDIEDDRNSRSDWEEQYKSGLELLGMTYEDRSEPFEGASGIVHPLLAESVTQFQAQAYREMLPAGGPVKTAIIGAETPEVQRLKQSVLETT
jgi:hypothetical protein